MSDQKVLSDENLNESQRLLHNFQEADKFEVWVKRPTDHNKLIAMSIRLPENDLSISDSDQKYAKVEKTDAAFVSYFTLYRYANCFDRLLVLLGLVSGLATGAAIPILFMVFGDLTTQFTAFGAYSSCSFTYRLCLLRGLVNATESEWNVTVAAVAHNFEADSIEACYNYVYAACGVMVCAAVYMACWSIFATRQTLVIRLKYFRSVLRQDIAFHDLISAGELNHRLTDNMEKIKKGIGYSVGVTLQFFGILVGCIVVAFYRSWKVTLVNFVGVPFLGIVASIIFKVNTLFTERELKAYAKAGSIAEEAFLAIRTVFAFGCQNRVIQRYGSNLNEAKSVGMRKRTLLGLSIGINRFIVFGMYAVSFWYGSILVVDGEIEAGDFVAAFFSVIFIAFALGLIMKNLEFFTAAKAAATQVFSVIDRKSKIDPTSSEGLKPENTEGSVQAMNLSFRYPARPEIKVLKNISFNIPARHTVALVGHSGSGKSTILKLIQRLYDPEIGTVSLGGHDVRKLNVHWLRGQIGVVAQEPVLFNTTIAENIRWGHEGVTDDDVLEACKLANAYDFIQSLPEKFNTLVGDRGAQVSGGQKQRIAIARAIIRKPKILLLDEATSALDAKNEALVRAALEKASEGRTTIVVAHRLSTVKKADKILVINNGEIQEEGTHQELMKIENGHYWNLVGSQLIEKVAREKPPTDYIASNHSPVLSEELDSRSGVSDTEEKEISDPKADVAEEVLPDAPFKRLWMLNKPEWVYIVAGCFFAIISGVGEPLLALVFGEVLAVFTNKTDQLYWSRIYSLAMFLLGITTFFGFWFKSILLSKSGMNLTERLRRATLQAILRQDISYFDMPKNSSGALCSRLSSDAAKVEGCTGIRMGFIVQNFSALGCGICIAFAFSWQMALLMLGIAPFLMLGSTIDMMIITSGNKLQEKDLENAAILSSQSINNIQLVASLTKEAEIHRSYEEFHRLHTKKEMKKSLLISLSYGYSQSITLFVFAAVFRLGIHLVANGDLAFEKVFSVILASIFGALAIGQNSALMPDFTEAKTAASRIIALLDSKPKIDACSEEGQKPAHCKGEVTLRAVHFHYPSRPSYELLRDFSLTVSGGQTLALVGQSGIGKSTSIQLIQRFYDVDEGQVLIDGIDVKDLNVKWLREQIGVVSQEPVLFNETIKENISFGDCTRIPDDQEIMEVARAANAHGFIESLPQKYDAAVGGMEGGQLSGGQKQRIAIARALLRNPKILLLDEATSALDAENEKIVQESLDAAREGRTCIVVAHRLSTVKHADQIAVIEDGKIVEVGTHDELLSLCGAYYNLIRAQLSSPRSETTPL